MPRSSNETACGSECINRMMYQECWPQTCPAKDRCSNQRIQRHHWSPGLERFMTRHRGFGIRTTETIHKGEFILEYIGEIVSDRLFLKRMNERYNNDQHHYCLKIEPGVVIDGYRVGNEGRFVNHSCEPNCEMQKWAVNGYYRICMFALRDIEPMEELFYDYNFHNFNVETKQTCHCGSMKCRGFINGKNSLNPKSTGSNSETGSIQMDVDVANVEPTILTEEI
ncbi:Bromo Adjacent Homology (BAH) domain contaning protein, partial [Euroglyphus maynei]